MTTRRALAWLAMLGMGLLLGATATAWAGSGPYTVTAGNYRFADRSEPLVATDRKVDLWSQVYRPSDLSRGPFPLIVLLHGNHGTCGKYNATREVRIDDRSDYTDTGKCPDGYVVTPNHLGYGYFASELASYGYVVVSINANRGITAGNGVAGDDGLNLMRGRLVLRHLALLSGWNRGTGPLTPPTTLGFNPAGTMDFSQVGLFGHSRGGEGIRAALAQLRDKGSPWPDLIGPVSIKSLFEIGPVDGQTSRVLDATGVNSIILLPSCDGDVSDLQGINVFDRVFLQSQPDAVSRFHGTAFVWGANHNAYNTQWQTSDARGCVGTPPIFQQSGESKPQQVTSKDMVVPFFRATVGKKALPQLAKLFNPTQPVPASIQSVSNVARGYLPAPIGPDVTLLTRFAAGGDGVSTRAVGVTVVKQKATDEHANGTRVATVSWKKTAPAKRFLQVNLSGPQDFSAYKGFSFRTALRCFGTICKFPAKRRGEMTYKIALVDANGQVSNAYPTAGHARISRPIGDATWNLHSTLYTIEIPLSAYSGIDAAHVKGIRFLFDEEPEGIVDITDLALLRSDPLMRSTTDPGTVPEGPPPASVASTAAVAPAPTAVADGNTIKIVRGAASRAAAAAPAAPATVTIVLTSTRAFPFTDALSKLKVGTELIRGGDIAADGKTMSIKVPSATFDKLTNGADVSLTLLSNAPSWQFGGLRK